MAIFHVVFKNTFFQVFSKLFTLGLSLFVITPLLTRHLEEGGYGAYTLVTAFILFFGTLSDWGTNIIAVREAVGDKDKGRVVFGTSGILRLFLSLIGFIVLNIVVRMNPSWDYLVGVLTIASFVLLFLSIKTTVGIVFQTLLRYELFAIVEMVSTVVFLVFVFLSVSFFGGLSPIIVAWLVATVAASLIGVILALRISRIDFSFDKKIARRILAEAFPTGALLMLFSVYNRIDTIILQVFQGDFSVGIYGLSYKVYDNSVMGAAFLMNAVFPIMATRFRSSPRANLQKFYQKIFDVLFMLGVFVFGVIFITAPFVVEMLGRGGFKDSVGVLQILSVAVMFAYLNHLTGYSLIALGKQRVSLVIALVALLFNVLLNLIFIPSYSYNAAAIITIATEGLILVLSTIAVWKTIGVVPRLLSFPTTAVFILRSKNNFLK
ncbi:MAG: flippase [Candidatus Blackburnbacteria bacterium]|nr:flippase [Candidatus Blackburnbacteria bacterium]